MTRVPWAVQTDPSAAVTTQPPIPSDPLELARWQHTRMRRDMLYGRWEPHLRARMAQALPKRRVQAWRLADLSCNVFRSAVSQVSVAYDRAPRVRHDSIPDALDEAVRRGGLWPLMQRVQRDTVGLREMLLRVDVVGDRPSYRPVYPDLVLAWSSPEEPERPYRLHEAILRHHPTTGRPEWTWERWDVSDPDRPRVDVVTEQGHDRSPEYLRDATGAPAPEGGLEGDAYEWRWAQGRPLIPYVLRHAQRTGHLWDSWEGAELVEGTLNVALLWSFWGHIIRNASWPQRYGLNVRLAAGATGSDDARRDHVVTDPATVTMFETLGQANPGAPSLLSAFPSGGDPHSVAEAIALYERRLAAFAGVSPSDIQRVAGDPRSGYALAVSREGQREAQRRWEPQLREGDEETLAITAALLNRALGSALPEGGYRVEYELLPPSAAEREAERKHILELIEAGLIDRVTAYQQLHPGITESDARAQLDRIRAINAQYS